MKKILVLIMALAISTSASYAASFWSSIKNAFRQDVKATKQAIVDGWFHTGDLGYKNEDGYLFITNRGIEFREEIPEDDYKYPENVSIKEINNQLSVLNKEMKTVKNDKNITETERVIRTRALQKQIDFYNNRKKELQK